MAFVYSCLNISLLLFNKYVFFTYKFFQIDLLVCLQLLLTASVCYMLRFLGYVRFPPISRAIVIKNMALAVTYTLNSVFALASLAHLSLSMYGVLKRASIVAVLVLDHLYGKRSSAAIQTYVMCVAGGAILAAASDLEFDLVGYVFACLSIIMKALNLILAQQNTGVKTKSTDVEQQGRPSEHTSESDVSTVGTIFYSSLLSFPFMVLLATVTTDTEELFSFAYYDDKGFQMALAVFIIEGVVLNMAIYFTVAMTSALTTSVAANMKLPLVTLFALMFLGEGRSGPWFILGIFLSSFGGIMYGYEMLKDERARKGTVDTIS